MLQGLRVVELATYIAAPSAAGMLADWGADVIKVEPPAGDAIRYFFSAVAATDLQGNPIFDLDNRGKRGVAIDIRTEEGQKALHKLIASADVFITNVRPGGLKRSRLDWDTLRKENPRLIYASVTGYGLAGEERDRPGFDMAAFWSRSGQARLTAPKGTDPFPLRVGYGDHVTGMATVSGILAALYEREKTGKGRLVETSLLRTGIYTMGSDIAVQLHFGKVASTRPRELVVNPLNNFFQTKCGSWLCLLTRHSGDMWGPIARAIGREDLIDDERFASAKSRRAHGAEIVELLDKEFAKHDLDEWAKRLDEYDVVWAPVQSPAEVTEDKQAIAAGSFVDVPAHDGASTFRSPAGPVRFHNEDGSHADGPAGPSPQIGEHTDEVLRELGYNDTDISALRESGKIR